MQISEGRADTSSIFLVNLFVHPGYSPPPPPPHKTINPSPFFSGHTFLPGNETFLPRQALLPQVIVFPAINAGESAYRTVVLGNLGDTPITYDLTSSLMAPAGQTVCGRSRCGTAVTNDQASDQK